MGGEGFALLDYIIFSGYILLIVAVGLLVSREKRGHKKTAQDYFMASKSLPWWAIGASLIAANISAEQFIGMSGSGYAIGLAIATYEWMAALTLVLVAKFLLPIFLEKKIYTMPQFLEMRYDGRVQASLAIFWILVYVFVNLTSVMYLGALALQTILGIPLMYGILGLALFAAVYSLYGGLKAVAWTDVVQVVFLVGGGLVTTYMALKAVSGGSALEGFAQMLHEAPEKFSMIIERGTMIPDGQGGERDAFQDLPGLGVLLGGMWVANIAYWGFNQFIIQRGLAAKDLRNAQHGLMFAAYLKLLLPLIVVIPGIAAYVITERAGTPLVPADTAYPWLLHHFVPTGLKGLTFAALVAAIVSSLASMLNSTSTIFTLDIYRKHIDPGVSETRMVTIGRITAFTALVIAVIAARPLLGGLDQAFQFIQNFTGMVTPGVLAIFLLGMFWKRATANAALWAALITIPLGFALSAVFPNLPFLDRMGYVFLILSGIIVAISLIESRTDSPKGIHLPKGFFRTGRLFNLTSLGICVILLLLYAYFW